MSEQYERICERLERDKDRLLDRNAELKSRIAELEARNAELEGVVEKCLEIIRDDRTAEAARGKGVG